MSAPHISKMFLYNLFPTLAGKFGQWNTHINRAADMGFNWIFLNPIQMPGISGSLYSIKDYYSFNPLLTDAGNCIPPEEQLIEIMETAGSRGINMMIDLVINHTAIDSPLTKEHPGWFLHDNKGRIEHPYAMDGGRKVVWGDLARLDYNEGPQADELYEYFRDLVKHLMKLGFSGFRCDAAYQIPQAVWKRLISEIKSSCPDTVFAAETLGCSREQTAETARAGFDYIFNSSKWWDFKSPWLMEQYEIFREICPSISFPESHDTERLAHEYKGDINALKRAYLFAAFFSTGVMIPMGFEFGFSNRLHVVDTRPEDWESTDMDLTGFISEVNAIKAAHNIFKTEASTETIEHAGDKNIFLLAKKSSNETALVAINMDLNTENTFSLKDLSCTLHLGGRPLTCSRPGAGPEEASDVKSYTLAPGDGIIFNMETVSVTEGN